MPIAPEDHLALKLDVTQKSAAEGVIAAARDKFREPPSLLVNSAGIVLFKPSVDVTDTDMDLVIDVNLKVIFLYFTVFFKKIKYYVTIAPF